MVIDCRGVKNQTCSAFKYRGVVASSDKLVDVLGKLVNKFVRTPDITKFVTKVSIEVRVCNPMLQKCFHVRVVLLNKALVSSIKLRKSFTQFMITKALLKKFTCHMQISIIEITDIAARSCKADKL